MGRNEVLRAWLAVPLCVGAVVALKFLLPTPIQRDLVGVGSPALLVAFAFAVDRFVFGHRN